MSSSILNIVFSKSELNENITPTQNRALDHLDFVNRQMMFNEVPVLPVESEWSEFDYGDYTAIQKSYVMKNHDHLVYFVNELLKEAKRIDHHPRMTIDHMSVELVLYTRDINDVTESDIKLSRIIDEIYNDIFFIG
tara:strand:+ start:772 stop:1179 length:408 start_codon:yes stop_codon:yes gene_type:complete